MTARYRGPLPEDLWTVLQAAHEIGGLSVQADFTRQFAVPIALAASMGWLSTIDPTGEAYGRRWRCTVAGLEALYNKEKLL